MKSTLFGFQPSNTTTFVFLLLLLFFQHYNVGASFVGLSSNTRRITTLSSSSLSSPQEEVDGDVSHSSSRNNNKKNSIIIDAPTLMKNEYNNNNNKGEEEYSTSNTRRRVIKNAASSFGLVAAASSFGCSLGCCPPPAYGLAQLTKPSTTEYDVARNSLQDAAFAAGMASGMKDYEREAYPKKKELFAKLFTSLLKSNDEQQPVVVEIGIGSFPNALYYQKMIAEDGLDIIGIDPNDRMEDYARNNAKSLTEKYKDNLRIVHGVSEALPLESKSVDAVVCTLTLCSVLDPERSLKEIKRVLKPGGKFLFWEHVLSQTDPDFAKEQIQYTPAQVKRADGCHLDRQTGKMIQNTNFAKLDMEYLELKNFGYLNPTVCGIATA